MTKLPQYRFVCVIFYISIIQSFSRIVFPFMIAKEQGVCNNVIDDQPINVILTEKSHWYLICKFGSITINSMYNF